MSSDLKLQGLSFGRSLQVAWKSSTIYSVEHPAVSGSLQQAFDKLQPLLLERQRFTFGFSDGRILLDNVLTTDPSLGSLESEFKRRDVAALAFSPGVTLADLKAMLRLISVPPKTVSDSGGIDIYLRDRQVPNARIIPSGKKKGQGNSDVVLGVDSESFLATGGLMGQAKLSAGTISLDVLLQAAGITEEAGSVAKGLVETVQTAVEATADNPNVRPESVILALATFLDNVTPGQFPTLPGVQGQEHLTSQELASELWESLTAQWLGSRFLAASSERQSEPQIAALEGDTVELLARAKNATAMAERILSRLARLFEAQHLPQEWIERIRQELAFYLLSFSEQQSRLMALKSLSPADLKRALRAIKGLVQENTVPEAIALANHCCRLLAADSEKPEMLECIPDVIAAVPLASQPPVLRAATEQLAAELLEPDLSAAKRHESVATCLGILGQLAARTEDFELAMEIASQFELVIATSPELHASCCREASQKLLPAEAIDRLIDSALELRESVEKQRTIAAMLRQSGLAIERLFERLEEESNAQLRFRIMRLARQLHGAGIHAALKRLVDERWYVVRNFCMLLGEMNDPELVAHLTPSLQHPDERVQRTAFQTLQKSRLPGCVRAYAESLPNLAPAVLESALDEIMLSRDAGCVEGLCKLVGKTATPDRSRLAIRAVQIAVAIDPAACVSLLAGVINAPDTPEAVRSILLQATGQHS